MPILSRLSRCLGGGEIFCQHDGIEFDVEAHFRIIDERINQREDFTITSARQKPSRWLYPHVDLTTGDELVVEWTVENPDVKAVYVMLHRQGGNDYYLSDRLEVGSPGFGRLTWTLADNQPVAGNKVDRIPNSSRSTAKTAEYRRKIPGLETFRVRPVNADEPQRFTFSAPFRYDFQATPSFSLCRRNRHNSYGTGAQGPKAP